MITEGYRSYFKDFQHSRIFGKIFKDRKTNQTMFTYQFL